MKDVYEKVLETFNIHQGKGYYYNEKKPNILLKLDDKQPQSRKMDLVFIKLMENISVEKKVLILNYKSNPW